MKNLLIIFAILFVLKLTEVVTWNWWIITLPLYIVPGIITALATLITIVATLNEIFD